jgi:sugar phosphate isomerase/epimerase
MPFIEALEIYKESGFTNIELNMYWKGGINWEVSQHLKGINPSIVVDIISKSKLELVSIHDCGGVIEPGVPSAINPQIHKYLNVLKRKDLFLVFHVPHIVANNGTNWWNDYVKIYEQDLTMFNQSNICIENLPKFNGYFVPLLSPEEMNMFICKNKVNLNLDTTHYAEMDVDIFEAINILKNKIKTVHLSNYTKGKGHLSIREGDLDIKRILSSFDQSITEIVTLEINVPKDIKHNRKKIIEYLSIEKECLENMINLK